MEALLADPTMMMLVVGGLATICVIGLAAVLFGDELGGGARRQRLQKVDGAPDRGGKSAAAWSPFGKAEASARDRLKELAAAEKNARAKMTLRLRLEQAGLSSSPAQFMLIFYVSGVVVGLATAVLAQQLIVAGGVAFMVAFLGPRLVLGKMIARRRDRFLDLFPNAIDILIRGVRSGLPVNESMKIAATELPDPIGAEFSRVIASINMGVSLEDALSQMSDRIESPDVNFFRTVLAIQKQTGGNLAEALTNLSDILRDRKKMKKKIVALSAEARMSAIIIGALPFIVGIMVYFMKPDYIMLLFNDELGQYMLAGGAVWMAIGIAVMRAMVKFEI